MRTCKVVGETGIRKMPRMEEEYLFICGGAGSGADAASPGHKEEEFPAHEYIFNEFRVFYAHELKRAPSEAEILMFYTEKHCGSTKCY